MKWLTPKLMLRFNGASTLFWLLMTPVALVTGWATSVTFVSVLSLWALVAASLSGYVASRVEVAQDEADIAAEVVAKVVSDTTLNHADE